MVDNDDSNPVAPDYDDVPEDDDAEPDDADHIR